ncbi:MAG: MarR family transcriptional regulator [Pleurocapsa sp. SU_196_0]|nr:MarR family transcriptional regulator [Pleurocapsa sp. SU_196_0]
MTIAGNQGFLKHLNRNALLRLLYTHPGASRAELARLSRLTRMTVGALVAELVAEGWVREGGSPRDGSVRGEAGRPGTSLELNPDRLCAFGAEVGVDYTTVVACDPLGRVLAQVHFPRAPRSPSDAAGLVSEGVNALLGEAMVLGRARVGAGCERAGSGAGWGVAFRAEPGLGRDAVSGTVDVGGVPSEPLARECDLGERGERGGARGVFLSLRGRSRVRSCTSASGWAWGAASSSRGRCFVGRVVSRARSVTRFSIPQMAAPRRLCRNAP